MVDNGDVFNHDTESLNGQCMPPQNPRPPFQIACHKTCVTNGLKRARTVQQSNQRLIDGVYLGRLEARLFGLDIDPRRMLENGLIDHDENSARSGEQLVDAWNSSGASKERSRFAP